MPDSVYDKFDYDTHWVSERLQQGLWGIENPLMLGILKFSMPWNVLALIYSVLFWDTLTPVFIYSSAFGLLWVNIAPYLIWYYDERVLPEFFASFSELLADEQERASIAKKYNEFFARHRFSVSAFWTISIVSIIYVSEPALVAMGMSGAGSLFLYTTYAYGIYIGAVLGHGFVGPVTTILLIHEITTYDLEIDPLHPDGLGGLSIVGSIAIRTTLLFSSASLFLPLLFYFADSGGTTAVIFGITGIYILTIFLSFLYPTVIVNRRAQRYRDSVLEDLRQQYATVEQQIHTPDKNEISELNKRLELQRVQRNFENYNSVSLYPLQLSILTRLAGSILLPILITIFQIYLSDML